MKPIYWLTAVSCLSLYAQAFAQSYSCDIVFDPIKADIDEHRLLTPARIHSPAEVLVIRQEGQSVEDAIAEGFEKHCVEAGITLTYPYSLVSDPGDGLVLPEFNSGLFEPNDGVVMRVEGEGSFLVRGYLKGSSSSVYFGPNYTLPSSNSGVRNWAPHIVRLADQ